MTDSTLLFYILLAFPIGGLTAFFKLDFLFHFIRTESRRMYPLYLLINCCCSFLSGIRQLPAIAGLFLDLLILSAIAVSELRSEWKKGIGPLIILFTLSTFMEAAVTILMRRLVVLDIGQLSGLYLQLAVTVLLGIIFFFCIPGLILRRYQSASYPAFTPYLYILLIPCSFLILSIRSTLGLDSRVVETDPELLGAHPGLFSSINLLGAMATFFILLEILKKVMVLSGLEIQKALLSSQLKEQRQYIEEAYKRNEQLRSFQHDIDNHLLVLSGLLREKEYERALAYLTKTHSCASLLITGISTGSRILDILLREKINYAEQNKIIAALDIRLPEELPIDDMDLCVIFSNALDNAITACLDAEIQKPELNIFATVRHSFLLIEITNSIRSHREFAYGTGLNNIRQTVLKYGGNMEIQQTENVFHLSLLLCLDPPSPPFTNSVPPSA